MSNETIKIFDAPTGSSFTFYAQNVGTQDLDIAVKIHADGRIEIGERFTLDDAAKAFWDAVLKTSPFLNSTPVSLPVSEIGVGVDGKEWAKTRAGYDHVEAVKSTADGFHGHAPWFYGWAVRQAFVAGAEWQEARSQGGTNAAPEESGPTP